MRKTKLRLVTHIATILAITSLTASSAVAQVCDTLSCDGGQNCYGQTGALPGMSAPSYSYGSNQAAPSSPLSANGVQSPMLQGAAPSGSGSAASGGGGGFSDLSLMSRSSPGSSFAAMAPGTYIDNAAISNMFRYRFDAAYGNPLPDRAEFFYGQCGCFGGNAPGPLLPERNVDYQEFTPYFERAVGGGFSLFAETPVRLINPDINDNTSGIGDINFGFKGSLYHDACQFLTAQFRVYAPTGDADRGLGTGHASLEPGVLYLGQLNDRAIVQSEFRVWIPLSDSQVTGRGNFAGTVLRSGVGLGYDLLNLDTNCQRRRLTGTFETVAWYITDGLAFGGVDNPVVLDADNDTIVNLKTGLRYTAGNQSIASSYGFAVTGDRWYSDIMRLEYRYAF